MKKQKTSLILNLINIAFILFATLAMMFRFKFMKGEELLVSENINVFKFFTVDSNILLLIVSIIYVIYLILLLKQKIEVIPKWVFILKIIGTVQVGITMVVTVCFLTFITGSKWLSLFMNSNLFFHLLCPTIAFVSLIGFEHDHQTTFKELLFSLIPLGLYSIFYTYNVLSHMENGKVSMEYDFYAFAQGGALTIIISVITIIGLCLLLTEIINIFNKKHFKKDE